MANIPAPSVPAPSKWITFKKKAKRILLYASIVILLIISFSIYWKYFFTYSDGYRAGLLQKFSRKGNVFKTFEGELILSSISTNKNVPIASEKFFFSVTNEKLAGLMDTIQGQMVIIHYKQKNGTLMWRGESTYLVDSVKVKP
jgi:hypothetical protein